MKPVIMISMGDCNGIGPEVILKAFSRIDLTQSHPIVSGQFHVFRYYNDLLGTSVKLKQIRKTDEVRKVQTEGGQLPTGSETDGREELQSGNGSKEEEKVLYILGCADEGDLEPQPSRITSMAGSAAMKAVELAVWHCMSGTADAMVTAPISKEAISKAGYNVPGHTEFLADRTGAEHVQMILVTEQLKVALATIHEPLKKVPSLITKSLLLQQLNMLNDSLSNDFSITHPKIALLGLNPHAGDGGVLGKEEQTILHPVLNQAARDGIHADGPFAADGFFGNRTYSHYDAVLAMYHDQGLIPFKTLSFGSGVNFTAGLPVIRTSPDHGTGFDIAGKNRASADSFLSAYNLAVTMARRKANLRKQNV